VTTEQASAPGSGAPEHRDRPRSAGSIGVLVPLIDDAYFSGILGGVAEETYRERLSLVVATTLHEHAREVGLLDRLRVHAAGAVVVLPEQSVDELLRAASDGFPLVVVDPLLPLGERIATVSVAQAEGARQAMRHLLALGHRRIAAVTGPPGWVATEERRGAYQAALAAAGIEPSPLLVVEADLEFGPGYEAAGSLLDLVDPPTAIFGFNDDIAIGAMHAAWERGLRVPDDLSVVGFGDLPHTTLVSPALTTVRQPVAEMGQAGVRLLMRMRDRPGFEPARVEVPTRLVIRGSTAPPRRLIRPA
jgi:LacI family transcriptional regulator